MKTEKKQHLKGSVLFTVVSVMSLLVIFLMGTLVLATSASNRSHKNYSSSQAEYTARAAIESFSQAMSQNAGVAHTVVTMGSGSKIEPTVVLKDSEMGSVGFYDNSGTWVDNKISVEYINDTYVFANDQWEAQQVLKVTATAKVGKEESTVSAYIRAKAPNEPKPLSIKGFQTLGGGGYTTTSGYMTGAMSAGITDDGNQTYNMSNTTTLDTEISFINGNFNIAGQFNIKASAPGVGTVVMGDLTCEGNNPIYISSDYAYASRINSTQPWEYADMTQKNIPYLYVDGRLDMNDGSYVKASGINTATELRAGAPFNVFCGTFNNSNGKVSLAADLYMMDEDGVSIFGNNGQSALTEWSSSVLNKTNSQFYSEGGNLYCNGTLRLNQGKINGDVRVMKDLYVDSNAKIYGDLVVKGNIYDASGNLASPDYLANIVRGNIYNGTVTAGGTGGLKPGYFTMANTYVSGDYLKPGYTRVQNFERPNVIKANAQYPNFIDGYDNYVRIEEVINEPYSGADLKKIQLKQVEYWPVEFADINDGTVYADANNYTKGGMFVDINTLVLKDENGNDISFSSVPDVWDGTLNMSIRTFYQLNGDYMTSVPYVDAKSNTLTNSRTSYYIYLADGSYESIIPENLTIYQADKYGNRTGDITDKLNVIYKVGPNDEELFYLVDEDGNKVYNDEAGNPYTAETPDAKSEHTEILDEITNELYTYYVPDEYGNATSEEATTKSIKYEADYEGNPTSTVTDEDFTYYKIENSGGVISYVKSSEADAIGNAGTGKYLAWYDANVDAGTNVMFYYNDDPTAVIVDQTWHNAHVVSEAEAYESVAVYPWSTYTNETYPEKMTREYINGDKGDSYKIITTLDEVRESVGCDKNGNFDSNTYYTEVPNVTITNGKYKGFDEVQVNGSGQTVNITKNTVITTGSLNGTPSTVNIDAQGGTLWIVLDNCNFNTPGVKINVNGSGTVNFLIKGTVNLENSMIASKNIYDQYLNGGNIIVREEDKLNINYYGSVGSTLSFQNNTLICGIAKCPYTQIAMSETAGVGGNWVYIDSNGLSKTHSQVAWIGNALFKSKTGGNNFNLLYTGSNDSTDPITNEALNQSWMVMYYDVY